MSVCVCEREKVSTAKRCGLQTQSYKVSHSQSERESASECKVNAMASNTPNSEWNVWNALAIFFFFAFLRLTLTDTALLSFICSLSLPNFLNLCDHSHTKRSIEKIVQTSVQKTLRAPNDKREKERERERKRERQATICMEAFCIRYKLTLGVLCSWYGRCRSMQTSGREREREREREKYS